MVLIMSHPVIMHINYCEQGQSIEEICKIASTIGFDGIEFRRKRTGVVEEPKDYLDEIAKYTKQYGIKYVLFGGGINVMTQDKDVREKEIASYNEFVDLASERLPLSINNIFTGGLTDKDKPMNDYSYGLHGSFCAQDWHWEVAAESCQKVSDHCKQYDIKFAFETHMNYIHDLAESAMKLVNMIDRDNFGVNLDYGNSFFFTGVLPLDKAIELCGDKLFYTHMKNYQPITSRSGPVWRLPTALGDGATNHRQYVKKLKEIGFDGLIGIEAPRPGDRHWYAECDYKYIKSVLDYCEF